MDRKFANLWTALPAHLSFPHSCFLTLVIEIQLCIFHSFPTDKRGVLALPFAKNLVTHRYFRTLKFWT
jgi:hypothetical protein